MTRIAFPRSANLGGTCLEDAVLTGHKPARALLRPAGVQAGKRSETGIAGTTHDGQVSITTARA